MKKLAQLYMEYGQLMVQSEIISGKISSVKQQIQEAINQPEPSDFKEVKVPDEKKAEPDKKIEESEKK